MIRSSPRRNMILLCPRCGIAYRSTPGKGVRHCPNDDAELQPAAAVDSRLGTTIGHYRVVDLLGKGGMGAVYVAEHIYIGKLVAIKILHEQYGAESDAVGRLLQEARAAAGIGHANIVAVSDFGETPDGLAYLVMEYVEGKPLDQLLEEEAPLPLFRAINIINQIGSGLAAAHEKGIVHRDLKPENVMLQTVAGRRKIVRGLVEQRPTVELETTYDHVKILDFGVAKILDLTDADPARRTMSGMIIGTPHYMAPETARARSDVDHRIDIYALGVLFYEMLTASLPFDGSSPVEVMLAHCSQPVVPLRVKNPNAEVTDAAEALILRALAKDPDDRPQQMDEFLEALQDCYGDENFLRNVEKEGGVQPGGYARPRTLTEDLKDLFSGGGGGGNEILERAFLGSDGPRDKTKK
ncbi:MAG: serine/threonine protein kinase [Myxococcales bacterium]|nr:serine/threonine protein kinase [Myxococcales bacterium]